MHITLISKQPLEKLPPLLSVIDLLKEHGVRLKIIATCEPNVANRLQSELVRVRSLNIPFNNSRAVLCKIVKWAWFRAILKAEFNQIDEKRVFWIGSGCTAMALGRCVYRHRFILQLNELYDNDRFYRRGLKPFCQKAAAVIMPEATRASIVQSWYNLPTRPIVLPNKPAYFIKPGDDLERTKKLIGEMAFGRIVGKKVVIYQGMYDPGNRNIDNVARAIRKLGAPWGFLVMGQFPESERQRLSGLNPEIVFVPFLTPPSHLEVTRLAYIGTAFYEPVDLNHLFCAPNKIWEYSAFDIPMLCSCSPALETVMTKFNAGICVEPSSVAQIQEALMRLDKSYSDYSRSSRQLYASVDMMNIMETILTRVEAHSMTNNGKNDFETS